MGDREAFLAQLRDGDERAWRRLMVEQGRLVFYAARRAGVDGADAEDVFQVAFLSAFRAIDSLAHADRLSSWLYRIAHRAAIDHIRRRRPNTALDDAGPLVDGTEPADAALARLEDAERVRAGVEELDTRCRELLTALYLTDPRPSYKEIAERLGAAVGSIGPTQARCLAKLARCLADVSNARGERSSSSNADAGRHEDPPAAVERSGRPSVRPDGRTERR